MSRMGIFAPLWLVLVCAVSGCGSGGGKSDSSSARLRAIASARVQRSMFAVASLALNTAPDPDGARSKRVIRKSPLHLRRSVTNGVSEEAALFYVTSRLQDQSGRLDLFLDSAHADPAGAFTWQAPKWNGEVPNAYPAVVSSTFQITNGVRAGANGTVDFTVTDAVALNGSMHITLNTPQGDYGEADFTVDDGMIKGNQHGHMHGDSAKWSWLETDVWLDLEGLLSTITFDDGSSETIQMSPDGSSTQKYYDPDGTLELNGDLQTNGDDSIDYSSGSSEDVNVDTGDPPADEPLSNWDDRSKRMKRARAGRRGIIHK